MRARAVRAQERARAKRQQERSKRRKDGVIKRQMKALKKRRDDAPRLDRVVNQCRGTVDANEYKQLHARYQLRQDEALERMHKVWEKETIIEEAERWNDKLHTRVINAQLQLQSKNMLQLPSNASK